MSIKNNELDDVSKLLKTMSDKTRLSIINLLFDKPMCVCAITDSLSMTQSAISHQLKVLKKARLVKSVRDGKHIVYSLDDDHIKSIYDIALNHVREEH